MPYIVRSCRSTTAYSSAVRPRLVSTRNWRTSSVPWKSPYTMFVFPTSMTSSISTYAYLAGRPSVFHFDLPDDVPVGDCRPIALGVADPRVLAIEVRVATQGHEELARPGIASRQGDPDVERGERDRGGLAAQEGARAPEPVPSGISELRHEPRNDAVEGEATIEAPARE